MDQIERICGFSGSFLTRIHLDILYDMMIILVQKVVIAIQT